MFGKILGASFAAILVFLRRKLLKEQLAMFYLPFDNLTLYTLPLHRGFALIGIYSLKGSLLCLCVYIYDLTIVDDNTKRGQRFE